MIYDKDFLMKREDIIYFDNAATTFKPLSVINKENEYNTLYTANASRGEYNLSFRVDDEIDNTRELVREFINAKEKDEIIFTSGATASLNLIVFGFFKYYLTCEDEIILNKAEHASNILPWIALQKEINFKIKYASLDIDNKLNLDSIKKEVTPSTKVIAFAEITNVIGDKRNTKEICDFASKNNILTVVDASQSIPHKKLDVQKNNISFLAFSAHKMLGPTGVGVMYAKKELLENMNPIMFGGGMNLSYDSYKVEYMKVPYKFEAGTQNISGIIAFSESIKYLNKVGMKNIERMESNLRKYLISELKKLDHVIIYNENSSSSIVLINVKDILPLDLGLFLNTYGICVRSGKHCSKLLQDEARFTDTVRISLYFYNSYKEIDRLIVALSDYEKIKKFSLS